MTNVNIEEILNLPEKELDFLIREIRHKQKIRQEEEYRKKVAEHTSLVGRCFKTCAPLNKTKCHKYYKIISARSSNECRVSALSFDEHPVYHFYHQISKSSLAGDGYFGEYNFNGIKIEDFPFYCNSYRFKNNDILLTGTDLQEISLQEFNIAMNAYINELQNMSFPADDIDKKDMKIKEGT